MCALQVLSCWPEPLAFINLSYSREHCVSPHKLSKNSNYLVWPPSHFSVGAVINISLAGFLREQFVSSLQERLRDARGQDTLFLYQVGLRLGSNPSSPALDSSLDEER